MLSAIWHPLGHFVKRFLPLAFLVLTLVGKLSEQCMSTPAPESTSVAVSTPVTTTPTPCTCPSGNCGFIIDTDSVTQMAISQMNLASVGSCACASGESEGCYPAQANANTMTGDMFIIDLECPDPTTFCVCDVNGNCFTEIIPGDAAAGTGLFSIQFFPFQDSGGCFVYAIPFCLTDNTDGIGTVTCQDAQSGVVGSNSIFIKALSASCRGCGTISTATLATCQASTFVAVATGKKR